MSNNSDREESKSDLDEKQASFTVIFGEILVTLRGTLARNVPRCLEQWNAFAATK